MDSFGLSFQPTATSVLKDSFTLPADMLRKYTTSDVGSLGRKFADLSLRQRRPAMPETFDPFVAAKLQQRFETRLKISENQAKNVFKSIQQRCRDQRENAPMAACVESGTIRLVEKLRRKEREEVAKIKKQLQIQKATQKKILIESLLPAQRRQYVQQLEQVIRERQSATEQIHQQRQQAEADRVNRERAAREAVAKQAAAEAAAKAKAEADAKIKASAIAITRRASQLGVELVKMAGVEVKKFKEAIKKIRAKIAKENQARQAEEENKVEEPQERQHDPRQQNPQQEDHIPSLSSSLLPQAVLQNRKKQYLQPCPELAVQAEKNVKAWAAFEAEMEKYRVSDLKLDKPFYQEYPNAPRELVTTVGEAINRVANTVTRPDVNKQPNQIELELQIYADQLIQRLIQLNVDFAHNPDVLKFAVFKLVSGFAQNKFVSAARQKDPNLRQETLVGFLVNIFDRLHFQLPQLCLKEIVLGFIASRNQLFYPKNAQLDEMGGSEIQVIEQRGYRINPATKQRESITATIGRLTIHSVIFFALHLSDAYIGRLFLMLSTLLSLQYTQNQAQIILHLLEIAGDRLLSVYGRAFVEQLNIVKNEFAPGFRAHIENGMINEPQNRPQYLQESDGDTGIRETGLELDKLVRLTDELLLKARQPQLQ